MAGIDDFIFVLWANLYESVTVQIFVISASVIVIGLLLMVWIYGIRLTHLDPLPLSAVEAEHPHIPSVRVLVAIFICSLCLLAAAAMSLMGLAPFDEPYQFLYLAAILVLAGTAGILSELRFRNGRQFPFAFTVGTSLAFIFLSFALSISQKAFLPAATLLLLLIASLVLARRVFFPTWSNRVQLTMLLVFIFWVTIYASQVWEAFQR
ncbi:MAG TPA: hypothetical protein VI913_05115 [Candidatus Peribacteraceae bacterium]|nr:hypothetical protein [Candidatus Peribacteraceae bacterium]